MTACPFSPAFLDGVRNACRDFERQAVVDAATDLRRAAVGIVLVDMADGSGGAGFLLTLRAAKMRAHSGQFALPGGRIDDGETPVETVIRECQEELGLNLSSENLLGILDDYPTRSGYAITPVILALEADQTMQPNPDEVAEVHRVDLNQIAQPGSAQFISIPESERRVIRIPINGVLIHAPTAAILYQFAELLAGRTTRVTQLEQPVFAWK